jgi:dihydroorotate dehydrogenase
MEFSFYKQVLRPALFALDAEAAHHFAMDCSPRADRCCAGLHRGTMRGSGGLSLEFASQPVGLAAGFDKNAVALRAWPSLGFGFAEVGTITARAQPGNPKPRIFRVPECYGIINRLGFNNDGADAVSVRMRLLEESGGWPDIPIGINLGKSRVTPLSEATSDYLLSFERLHHFGDYFVLNISSPNTPGLRALQDPAALDELLGTIQRRNIGRRPLLVKIAPDLQWEAIEQIVALAQEHELSGIVATNTTLDHSYVPRHREQQGGLSGLPLRERSTEIVRFISKRTTLPIIAVGGIFSADDALEKFDAGAALVQVYTGFIYEGPQLLRDIFHALLHR